VAMMNILQERFPVFHEIPIFYFMAKKIFFWKKWAVYDISGQSVKIVY